MAATLPATAQICKAYVRRSAEYTLGNFIEDFPTNRADALSHTYATVDFRWRCGDASITDAEQIPKFSELIPECGLLTKIRS